MITEDSVSIKIMDEGIRLDMGGGMLVLDTDVVYIKCGLEMNI